MSNKDDIGATIPEIGRGKPQDGLETRSIAKASQMVVGWLVYETTVKRGKDERIHEGKNLIGSGPTCDIVIEDPFASERHASLRYEDGAYNITDLDSKNGTIVNDQKTAKTELRDNDVIQIGDVKLKFKGLFFKEV